MTNTQRQHTQSSNKINPADPYNPPFFKLSINQQNPRLMSTKPIKTINVTREQIMETKAFQDATKMLQSLTLNRTNSKWIQHGVNVSVNIGFDKWNKQTEASFTNTKIIKELVDNYLTKNQN